ncbi:MAG: AIPR family protein [Acidobacteria bacterium]|nr:AIPR family protein [Acidobacteriota bacterium]
MKEKAVQKVQFRDRLIEWAQQSLGTKFDNLNNTQRSRQMIRYFVLEVLEKLLPGLVPDDEGELDGCIVDGAGDGGADLLYRTDEGQVLLIQAKYRGNDVPETAESVGRFCDLLERLYLASQGKQQSLNKDILEIAGQIDWEADSFRLYFITTGKTGKSVQDRVDQGLTNIIDIPDLVETRSEFRYLDYSGLNQELREALSSADFANKPIRIQMIPDTKKRPWCHFEGDDRELYVGEVSGGVLANILQEHKASLFTMNIRDYVGDTKTNQRIIYTALNDPANFEYFNNGVTAVAAKITPDPSTNTLECERMSIINGAQTVRSLLAATKKKSNLKYKPLDDVKVLMRLMSFSYPAEIPFVGEVTRYNNTQNAIKIADFRSNDEVQKDLARRFGGLNLSGKTYEYKNKRSTKKRNTIAITLEEFTKTVFAYSFGPDDMFGGTSKLFDVSLTGLYRRVFESPDILLTEQQFNLLSGTYFACDFVKQIWENRRRSLRLEKKTMHPALERKGLIFFTIGELQRRSYTKEGLNLDQDLAKLSKPNGWLAIPDSKPKMALASAFEIASKILIQQYDASQKKDSSFKHRNWFREPNTLDDLRSGTDLALEFGALAKLWS